MSSREKIYKAITAFFRFVSPRSKTYWEEPFAGEPCVFIGNHAGLWGPWEMCIKFPLRDECYSWMNAGMMFKETIPAYVRQDYWWKPGCKLEPLYDKTLPYIAAAILPPIAKLPPVVPVYHDMRAVTTFRQSLKLLKEGKHLIIYPEQPSGYQSHHDWINTGFLRIAPMYYKATGKCLRFYPVHIDYKKHEFRVAKPIAYDPNRTLDEQTPDFVRVLAAGLRGQPVKEDVTAQ